MNAEQYAKAKELFFDLVGKSSFEQEERLRSLDTSDSTLAQEVRQLLANHSSRTIIGATIRAGNTTTGATNYVTLGWMRLNKLLVGGFLPLALAILATLVVSAVGWFLHQEMSRRVRNEYQSILATLASQKTKRVVQWAENYQLRVQDWGRQPKLQELVRQLNEVSANARNERDREDKLQEAEAQKEVACVFDAIASRPLRIESMIGKATKDSARELKLKYAIWNSSFELVADWQFKTADVNLGTVATSTGKLEISRVFETKSTHVVFPQPSAETVSKEYPLETEGQYVMFFVPIFSLENEKDVIGAMMVRSNYFVEELHEILDDRVLVESNCYLVNLDGVIASEVQDKEGLLKHPAWSESKKVRKHPVLYCLDPGVDVLAGKQPAEDISTWSRTLAARGLSMKHSGQNVVGYRDYRGRSVVGAWHWMEEVGAGLVLEVPQRIALENLQFVGRVFLFMLSIPGLSAAILVGMSLVRAFRSIEFTNRFVGPYRLRDKIGEGGLGVVYRGEHKMLGRQAAVKLIKPGIVSTGSMRRFEREVRLAAALQHPNAVNIYDFGISREGLLYCAMELVDGATLAQIVSYSPSQPIQRSIHLLQQISSALAEAHALNLVHRDIKPQNIMVCRKSPYVDTVKVVDFGLAKNINETLSRDMTATRVVMGTPGFIAPERLESPWVADPKIDVFSFGVLGMYLLAAKVPPIGITQAGLLEIIQMQRLEGHLTNPAFMSLIRLLLKCAAPLATDRPQSMHEVSKQFDDLAILFPWTRTEAESWWEQNNRGLRKWIDDTKHAK